MRKKRRCKKIEAVCTRNKADFKTLSTNKCQPLIVAFGEGTTVWMWRVTIQKKGYFYWVRFENHCALVFSPPNRNETVESSIGRVAAERERKRPWAKAPTAAAGCCAMPLESTAGSGKPPKGCPPRTWNERLESSVWKVVHIIRLTLQGKSLPIVGENP